MGIYASDDIYGIRIYTFKDDLGDTLFEIKHDVTLSDEQMKEAYLFYSELNNKNDIFFSIYTECSSTLDTVNREIFMMWHPMSLDRFLEKFGI
jgi:hypothetical protein